MKEGDKVYCKKTLLLGTNTNPYFFEGNFYFIGRVSDNSIYIQHYVPTGHMGHWFNNNGGTYRFYFKEYFYTEKELRKMKLEEISK